MGVSRMSFDNHKIHNRKFIGSVPDAYRHLVVNRGNNVAYMRTESFIMELKPLSRGKAYRYLFDPDTVRDPTHSCFAELDVEALVQEKLQRTVLEIDEKAPPPQRYKDIRARWIDPSETDACRAENVGDGDNLFGRNGAFLVSNDPDINAGKASNAAVSLRIPSIDDPTDADFAFYGCKLLHHGDVIGFDEPLPLFTSDRTSNYASDYLLENTGIYVEKHDIVHLHQPMMAGHSLGDRPASSGYWVLCREVTPDLYRFSALKIPSGLVAMMPPGVIHNDVYLKGLYRAVYGSRRTRTVQISSVIVRDVRDGAKLHLI